MVFIDRHNKLVNCVSSDFKVKLYERLQSVPKDVAYINNKLVVATTLEINIYAIDNTNDTFQLLKCHRTDNELVAISPIIENKLAHLLSGYRSGDFVQVRDRKGKMNFKWLIHEIMALFVLRKLIPQTRMRSHRVGLDFWLLVGPFVYFHTLCVRTAKALARLRACAGSPEPSLVAYAISTIISCADSNMDSSLNLGILDISECVMIIK